MTADAGHGAPRLRTIGFPRALSGRSADQATWPSPRGERCDHPLGVAATGRTGTGYKRASDPADSATGTSDTEPSTGTASTACAATPPVRLRPVPSGSVRASAGAVHRAPFRPALPGRTPHHNDTATAPPGGYLGLVCGRCAGLARCCRSRRVDALGDDQAVIDLPVDLRSVHASITRSVIEASAFFRYTRGS